jgi:predicted Zn finger-like uncharacterized protein
MDVACPQCRTEYEFEDARIPDDGLTVKCTQCSHVFRMKKKVPVPTEPSAGDDQGREWRLRQPSGNVFNFRHLTTLQKWIVERKVQKQDEISLTGESWKRLGDIAELASFFQVVDDAARAAAPPPPPPPPSEPPPPLRKAADTLPPEAPIKPKLIDTLPSPGFSTPPPPARPPQPSQSAVNNNETIRGQSFSISRDNIPVTPMNAPLRRNTGPVMSALREEPLPPRGGAMKWVALALVIIGAGGAGGYYYLNVWVPEQERLSVERQAAADQQRVEQERLAAQKKADEEASRLRAEQEAAAIAAAAAKRDAGPPPVVDAGSAAAVAVVPSAVDAGVAEAPKPKPMDFDQLLAAGERLRARDNAKGALAMFTKAAEMRPDRVEPQSGGGFALLDLEKPDQAELAFRGALAVNPRYGPALIGMAEASKALGKKPQAVEYYQKYLDVLPNGPEAAVARNSIERLK